MMSITELKDWLATHNSGFIAIDEGGLTLVILDEAEQLTGQELEVGGIPDESPAFS